LGEKGISRVKGRNKEPSHTKDSHLDKGPGGQHIIERIVAKAKVKVEKNGKTREETAEKTKHLKKRRR